MEEKMIEAVHYIRDYVKKQWKPKSKRYREIIGRDQYG